MLPFTKWHWSTYEVHEVTASGRPDTGHHGSFGIKKIFIFFLNGGWYLAQLQPVGPGGGIRLRQ